MPYLPPPPTVTVRTKAPKQPVAKVASVAKPVAASSGGSTTQRRRPDSTVEHKVGAKEQQKGTPPPPPPPSSSSSSTSNQSNKQQQQKKRTTKQMHSSLIAALRARKLNDDKTKTHSERSVVRLDARKSGDVARRFRAKVDGKKVAVIKGLWSDEEREAYAESLFSRYADADVSFQTRLACIDKAGAPTSGSSFSSPENAPHSVMTMGVATLGDFVEQCFQSSHEESHFLLDEDILSEDAERELQSGFGGHPTTELEARAALLQAQAKAQAQAAAAAKGLGSAPPQRLELPRNLFPDGDWFDLFPSAVRPKKPCLIMGGAGARSSLHCDPMEWTGWNYLVEGSKLWTLFPADDDEADAWESYFGESVVGSSSSSRSSSSSSSDGSGGSEEGDVFGGLFSTESTTSTTSSNSGAGGSSSSSSSSSSSTGRRTEVDSLLSARRLESNAWDGGVFNISAGWESPYDLYHRKLSGNGQSGDWPSAAALGVMPRVTRLDALRRIQKVAQEEHPFAASALHLGLNPSLEKMNSHAAAAAGGGGGDASGAAATAISEEPSVSSSSSSGEEADEEPLLRRRRITVLQREGELLLIPPRWWHQTYHLEPSVALAGQYLNANNIDRVRGHVYAWCGVDQKNVAAAENGEEANEKEDFSSSSSSRSKKQPQPVAASASAPSSSSPSEKRRGGSTTTLAEQQQCIEEMLRVALAAQHGEAEGEELFQRLLNGNGNGNSNGKVPSYVPE